MRAYTHIDRGSVRIGNDSLERTWSTFLGNTTYLIDKAGRTNWVAEALSTGRGDGPEGFVLGAGEVQLAVDQRMLTSMDFGEIEWSEESSPVGASLVARYAGTDVDVEVRTFTLHTHPGMVRTLTVTNRSANIVRAGPALLESVPLRAETTPQRERLPQPAHALGWRPGSEGVVAVTKGRGILMFAAEEASPAVEAGHCLFLVRETVDLAPGKSWVLPPAALVMFQAPFNPAAQSVYSEFLRMCALARKQMLQPHDEQS